jgi:hypothetical protein
MPEGLRNAGPMFCRMTNAALKDIVVTGKKKEPYISDLSETFANMHEAHLKFNSEKCIFGGNKRQCIGLFGIHQRYRGQPRQNKSNHPNATSVDKERSAEAKRPHSSTQQVEWGAQQQQAFDDLKYYLEHLPTLSSLEQGQPLILYVSATHFAVSGALVATQ